MTDLAALAAGLLQQWGLRGDGTPIRSRTALVLPVRTGEGVPAVLKVAVPEEESEHEHLALRHWNGNGSARLLRADPHRCALLLERLSATDLTAVPDVAACRIVAGLYPRLHLLPLPQLRTLSSYIERWTAELTAMPRSAPIPHRLVEQAISIGSELVSDRSVPDRLLHTDLHYANVLSAGRQPWLVIDPKPRNGDPHYEVAPLLWNRWDEIADDVRSGVRRRFWTLVDAAGFDEERARGWVIVRMVHNVMWELQEARPDPAWITKCVAVAKAVQD